MAAPPQQTNTNSNDHSRVGPTSAMRHVGPTSAKKHIGPTSAMRHVGPTSAIRHVDPTSAMRHETTTAVCWPHLCNEGRPTTHAMRARQQVGDVVLPEHAPPRVEQHEHSGRHDGQHSSPARAQPRCAHRAPC